MRIGVIGHRNLLDRPKAIAAASACFRNILGDPSIGTEFELLSCLAEGADRAAIEAARPWPRMRLVAVLPLAEGDYARDFALPGSVEEFAVALRRAAEVVRVTTAAGRPEAYRQAGRYVVDHCDHLVALWDGGPTGRLGGTADTLSYARERLDSTRIHVVPVVRGSVEAGR